jgi:hypothetical protein
VPNSRGPDQKIGLEASERGPFRNPASFLAKIGAAGRRSLELPFLARLGDEHTYPFRSQMAKVELREQQRGAGVAQIVEAGRLGQPHTAQQCLEGTHSVAVRERRANAAGEH